MRYVVGEDGLGGARVGLKKSDFLFFFLFSFFFFNWVGLLHIGLIFISIEDLY